MDISEFCRAVESNLKHDTKTDALANTHIEKSSKKYCIKDNAGHIMSSMDWYDYSKKNFDWILLADVETKEKFRGMGLASKLINTFYNDITKKSPNKGIYLLVKSDNVGAIKFYKKTGFSFVKKYKINDGHNKGMYDIMCKGKADKRQLMNMNFG